jgi:hypothetical protein
VQEQKSRLAKTSERLAQLHTEVGEAEQKMADLHQSHRFVQISVSISSLSIGLCLTVQAWFRRFYLICILS